MMKRQDVSSLLSDDRDGKKLFSLPSRSVERILNLVRQIFPKQLMREGINDEEVMEESLYWNYHDLDESNVFLLLVGNLGDTSDCNDLAICNAIRDYSANFDAVSRCIINVHNDLFHVLYFVQNICEKYKKLSSNRSVMKYNMICNYDFKKTSQLLNHFSTEYLKLSQKVLDNKLKPLNVIFWSGHGDQFHGLSFQKEQYLSFRNFISYFLKPNTPMNRPIDFLFIFECCYSNTSEILEYVNNASQYDRLFVCSSIEKSGGWICDGVDSNGILTNFIIDPVSSYFKVKFRIFFDLGPNAFEYFPYEKSPIKQQFYSIIDRYLSKIFKLVLPSSFIQHVSQLPATNASIIRLVFKHFILFNFCLDALFQKQTPFSHPSITIKPNALGLFNEMAKDVDELLLEIFRKKEWK